MSEIKIVLSQCFYCSGEWGACTCKWQGPGFEYDYTIITEPNVGVSGFPYVNPYLYYGAAFLAWAHPKVPPLSTTLPREVRRRMIVKLIRARCAREHHLPEHEPFFGYDALQERIQTTPSTDLFLDEQFASGWGDSAVIDALIHG